MQLKSIDEGIETPFLFVYQAEWQRKLLERYGGEILFLDAVYRTTRCVLTLFFLTVRTNIDYQIVATFVVERETKEQIIEALEIVKLWNPNLTPAFCMTDYCTEEIDSLETVFRGKQNV